MRFEKSALVRGKAGEAVNVAIYRLPFLRTGRWFWQTDRLPVLMLPRQLLGVRLCRERGR